MREIFGAVLEFLQQTYTLGFGTFVAIIGLWTIFIDTPKMKKKDMKREAGFYRILGLAYVFGGLGLAVALKIFS